MDSLLVDFTEEEIGAIVDAKFPFRTPDGKKPSYHEGQRRAIVEAVNALANLDHRTVIIEAPTGIGKSVIAYTIHKTLQYMHEQVPQEDDTGLIKFHQPTTLWRTTISCPTKGLQDQYVRDFDDMALLKGRSNYACAGNRATSSTRYGSPDCISQLKDRECHVGRCPYRQARDKFMGVADLRVTNSHLWIATPNHILTDPASFSQLHIMDECHMMPKIIVDMFEMPFNVKMIQSLKKKGLPDADRLIDRVESVILAATRMNGKDLQEGHLIKLEDDPEYITEENPLGLNPIKIAADDLLTVVNSLVEKLDTKMRNGGLTDVQEAFIDELMSRLSLVSNAASAVALSTLKAVIVQKATPNHLGAIDEVTLKPIVASDVTPVALNLKTDYTVLMSATICGTKKFAESLGIESYYPIELDHPIPLENRIINYVPVGRMSGKHLEGTKPKMVESIDELIDLHIEENGVVHTSSYALAEYIKTWSRHSDRILIGKDRKQTMAWLEHGAKEGNKPCVVVSPSMTTGYDLKGDLARWGAIAKIPFGILGDPLVKYRADRDFASYTRETVLEVEQACGRVVRGVNDYGVMYILDESFDTVLQKGKPFLAQWFMDAIVLSE
ncbi:DinG family ATP-dependent helicase [Vibrio phage vB_VcorM_GR28A]|nr:DinG family ATP-dependent helicase [Vibrio phage vB_VcorM_GR28A]